MPTVAGTPLAAAPGGALHQVDWLSLGCTENELLGAAQQPLMRGTGGALGWWQHRFPRGPQTWPQGAPYYVTSRQYSRGAAAHAPHFGTLPINPIGAGIYAPYKLPVIAGPGARYVAGAIFFDVQDVPTSLQLGPTVPIETVNALIQASHAGGSYLTTG